MTPRPIRPIDVEPFDNVAFYRVVCQRFPGMSERRRAKAFEITSRHYEFLRKGDRQPGLAVYLRILDVLDLPPGSLQR